MPAPSPAAPSPTLFGRWLAAIDTYASIGGELFGCGGPIRPGSVRQAGRSYETAPHTATPATFQPPLVRSTQ
jgi:hypothetical protein